MNRKRILVADDEQVIRMIMSLALREKYEIDEAVDGEDAWKKFLSAEPPYAVVMLDLNMPRVGGIELLQRILAHNPGGKVVLLTGDPGFFPDAHPSVRLVHKPFTNQLLLAAVEDLLGADPGSKTNATGP